MMDEQEIKIRIKEIIKDFRLFAFKYLKIKPKKGKLIPFVLNKAQLVVLEAIEKQIQEGVPVRVIILKARQKGISTLIEAFMFWRNTYTKHRKAAVIGHVRDATDNLWDMTNRYYDNLPQWLQVTKKYHNAKELTYKDTKSEIIFWTAETGDVGSSHTVQDLHITELSKWRDPKTTLTALLQTIPDEPNTMVIMESTANGFGGEFYNRWRAAEVGKGNYVPIFLSWLIDDEYTLPFENEKEKEEFCKGIDEIEIGLLKKGAKLEHLKWRRDIGLPDKCGNDVDQFKQEYPSDPLEAFITSGRPVFKIKTCNEHFIEYKDKKPLRVGNLAPFYDVRDKKYQELVMKGKVSYYDLLPFLEGVEFVDNPKGYISIWKKIDTSNSDRYRYAAGGDVAEGLEQGDYSSLHVLDRRFYNKNNTLECALSWHGHIDTDQFAEEQHKIQVYLDNQVWFCTERNNHGLSVINYAYKLGVNQYFTENFDKGFIDSVDSVGFKTSEKSKAHAINLLIEMIREDKIISEDVELWRETLTYVRDSKGKMGAQDKQRDPGVQCFDDRIISMALGIVCHFWMNNYEYIVPKEELPWQQKLKKKKRFVSSVMSAG